MGVIFNVRSCKEKRMTAGNVKSEKQKCNSTHGGSMLLLLIIQFVIALSVEVSGFSATRHTTYINVAYGKNITAIGGSGDWHKAVDHCLDTCVHLRSPPGREYEGVWLELDLQHTYYIQNVTVCNSVHKEESMYFHNFQLQVGEHVFHYQESELRPPDCIDISCGLTGRSVWIKKKFGSDASMLTLCEIKVMAMRDKQITGIEFTAAKLPGDVWKVADDSTDTCTRVAIKKNSNRLLDNCKSTKCILCGHCTGLHPV